MLGSLLHKIGDYLLNPFGMIHDSMKGYMAVATSQTIGLKHEAESDQAWADTVKYYIGGTFVVTALLILVFFSGKLFKKTRSYTRRKKASKKRVTRRRTTYKKRKK